MHKSARKTTFAELKAHSHAMYIMYMMTSYVADRDGKGSNCTHYSCSQKSHIKFTSCECAFKGF